MQTKHFFTYLQNTMRAQWSELCMVNIDGTAPYTYESLTKTIARMHTQFEVLGIQKGDKIALVGRNCSNWAVSFLAITSYQAVAVSILPDFTSENIVNLVNHSESKLLIVVSNIAKKLDWNLMPGLQASILMDDLSIYSATSDLRLAYMSAGLKFDQEHAQPFPINAVHYPVDNFSDVALINYTSGSTGNPKGVMLTFMNLSQNVHFAVEAIPHRHGDQILSMLPIAHMFGLMFEFLYPICEGTRVFFLTSHPTPSVLMKAFVQVHPYMILTVPLVIEKIVRKSILPVLNKPVVRILWRTPGVKILLRRKVASKLLTAFGGQLRHLIIGGAALNQEVEHCLRQMQIPYCVGYGMTECAPLLSYTPWQQYVSGSCGQAITGMEFRIDSEDSENMVGEVQVRGLCVMQGYYKNPTATKDTFTSDGWMRTGDLGVIDSAGNVFLRGRSKNMILGPNGQNIYPEEIEDKLNSLPLVVESVVVSREGKIIALVFPDYAAELRHEQLAERMEKNRQELNRQLPAYSQVAALELVENEFEKTPKKSIKRFLYS